MGLRSKRREAKEGKREKKAKEKTDKDKEMGESQAELVICWLLYQ